MTPVHRWRSAVASASCSRRCRPPSGRSRRSNRVEGFASDREARMEFSITTEVDAPPEVVFAVLSEVEHWHEWTPTVTRVERLDDAGAPLALGSRIRIVQPKVPPAEWTVTALEPGRGFRLRSGGENGVQHHDRGRRSSRSGFRGSERGRALARVDADGHAGRAPG